MHKRVFSPKNGVFVPVLSDDTTTGGITETWIYTTSYFTMSTTYSELSTVTGYGKLLEKIIFKTISPFFGRDLRKNAF